MCSQVPGKSIEGCGSMGMSIGSKGYDNCRMSCFNFSTVTKVTDYGTCPGNDQRGTLFCDYAKGSYGKYQTCSKVPGNSIDGCSSMGMTIGSKGYDDCRASCFGFKASTIKIVSDYGPCPGNEQIGIKFCNYENGSSGKYKLCRDVPGKTSDGCSQMGMAIGGQGVIDCRSSCFESKRTTTLICSSNQVLSTDGKTCISKVSTVSDYGSCPGNE